jgi:phosphoribosylaminoimidazolecarboxamide formyltransferase/IMP cyclohydrolase
MAVRTALLSVSDKTGLLDFARGLVELGASLLSTGGTYRSLHEAGISVKTVESYTESPEIMDGRVTTLHPRVHGGLLARAGKDDEDLQRIGGVFIDLVAVNLYPFEKTLQRPGASFEELIENIDIGGPSMLRSAAKNHDRVTVVCDAADYALVIEELRELGAVRPRTRQRLAAKVFAHTSAYDSAIARWLSART